MLALLALLPILMVLCPLVFLSWPAARAMPPALGAVALLALSVWRVPVVAVGASVIQGAGIALTVLWIIFGSSATGTP